MRGEKYHRNRKPQGDIGSSPHARGKAGRHTAFRRCTRIIPACAGKSAQTLAAID